MHAVETIKITHVEKSVLNQIDWNNLPFGK